VRFRSLDGDVKPKRPSDMTGDSTLGVRDKQRDLMALVVVCVLCFAERRRDAK
jgi:hypothetical protein